MNSMVQSLKDLSQMKLMAMIAMAVVLIGFFAYLSLRVAAPMMSPLYTSMPAEDGAKIVAELEVQNVPYELRANGTQILVPSDQVDRLRLKMVQKGLPSQGSMVGYEIFDKGDTLGTSNFVLTLNQLRALEGELARTISSFDTVENARVHLVTPKRELFSRDTMEPTASVAVKLRSSGGLNKNEIAAIRHLVATAVPGLKPQRVTIVDNHGALLAKGVDENDTSAVSEDAEQFRSEYEKRTVDRVERLLEQSVGVGKVKAEVHADIDFNRIIKNSEKFDPEGQVARSVQAVNEKEVSNEKNTDNSVSVANNLPAAQANSGGAGTNSNLNKNRTEETTNFEISKETTNSVKEAGTVNRLTVAVMVDGVYTPDKDGNPQYAPRSEDELKKLQELVQSAVGYNAARGDDIRVVTMPFATNPTDLFATSPLDWLKNDLNSIIQTLVLGGVAILAILLVIRPLVARAIESSELASKEDELEKAALLAAPTLAARLTDQSRGEGDGDDEEIVDENMINIDRIQGKVRSSLFNKINDIIEKNPDETVQIMRQWLNNG